MLRCKIIGATKKFKNWPSSLFRPRTDHAWHQKPNPSLETAPSSFLSVDKNVPEALIMNRVIRGTPYVSKSHQPDIPFKRVSIIKKV